MKSLSENQNNNSDSGCFANWLDFSLSPQMKMETNNTSQPSSSSDVAYNHYHNHDDHQSHEQSPGVSTTMSMLLSAQHQQHQQQQLNGVCFENNGGFLHTPLSVMPLKSDGSLCIMEALSRSQHSQVPKLEDFLGRGQERETMELSLDSSIYYQQTAEQESHRQQQQQQQLFESYLSAMACQDGFSEESLYKNWVNNAATVDNINSGEYVDNNDGSGVTLSVAPQHSALSCGELQSLSLSMSPGSQSSSVTVAAPTTTGTECVAVNAMENSKKRGLEIEGRVRIGPRKSIETFGQRTSQYRGVTKHRWTGRYEAHLWDNSCKKEGQTRKGRQVYLGGYDLEEKAARSYDLAALKYWGVQTHTNFPVENYTTQIEEMKNMTRQEFVAHLRRKSSGFSRGASIYRGVTRHHQHGRWQARIGRVAGNKDLYLGTFSTQEEAAEAYDVAAIKFRGLNAVTNFDIGRYDVEAIMGSNTLLVGDQAKRNKIERIEQNPSAENDSDQWNMGSYHSQTCMSKNNGGDHYPNDPNPSFSLALQDLVGHDSTRLSSSSAHFSNASSLVTSLNSSSEGSPDRNGSPPLSKSLQMASGFVNQANVVTPWLASGEVIRPAVAHLPVCAAWSDA